MKAAIVFLSLVCLGLSAPQPRKPFHDHFSDFVNLILEESEHEMEHLNGHYLEFDEFKASLDFMAGRDFNSLVHEMEDLPEFKAVVEFLEGHEIDITYYIDMFNDIIDNLSSGNGKRHELSGINMSAYIQDTIALLPKEKLAAMYDEKMENDEEFKRAMDSLQSEEWQEIWNALWENETFKAEADLLAENGIELQMLLTELVAIFGQN
uniref:Single domain major allergen protein n=1 Tax=Anthocharis cardamines TaxID=227532 RepID=B2KSG4_ANTCA|nr:single domain major allergen protein [Anthocharis cardamines]